MPDTDTTKKNISLLGSMTSASKQLSSRNRHTLALIYVLGKRLNKLGLPSVIKVQIKILKNALIKSCMYTKLKPT